jgi:hypothetical protein
MGDGVGAAGSHHAAQAHQGAHTVVQAADTERHSKNSEMKQSFALPAALFPHGLDASSLPHALQ